jgi:hypothetical protein
VIRRLVYRLGEICLGIGVFLIACAVYAFLYVMYGDDT